MMMMRRFPTTFPLGKANRECYFDLKSTAVTDTAVVAAAPPEAPTAPWHRAVATPEVLFPEYRASCAY